jgi:Fic family protein
MPPAHYHWKPIGDLEGDPEKLAASELRSLSTVWREQRDRLQRTGQLARFNEELGREFAIETGILEHLYTLDRGVTRVLIERGIDAALIPHDATDRDPDLVASMIQDQHEAAKALFDFVGQQRPLSTAFIKELHALLTRNQASTTALDSQGRTIEVTLLKGEYKRHPNKPQRRNGTIHEYAPPEHVASEMDRLVEWHLRHQDEGWPAEVEAAWLHHRFTQIHPFQDGNGRVARCLASLVLIRADWFYLAIGRDQRAGYIESLESADQGDLQPLVELVARQQRKAFVRALSLARQVEKRARVSQIIEAAKRDLDERKAALREGWDQLEETAGRILQAATERFEEVRGELASSLGSTTSPVRFEFFVDSEEPHGERSYWFRWQVIQSAKNLDYFANLNEFHGWSRLRLRSGPAKVPGQVGDQTDILLSIHGLGQEYSGVLAASLSSFKRILDEADERPVDPRRALEVKTLTDEVFQINYVERPEEALRRFGPWFENALARGLERWRKSL